MHLFNERTSGFVFTGLSGVLRPWIVSLGCTVFMLVGVPPLAFRESHFIGVMTLTAQSTNCTLFAAANGSDTNSGTSPTAPKTLQGASQASGPGSVICLKGGTYNLASSFYPRSGTASAWITFKNYGDGDVNVVWTGGGGQDTNMFHFYGTSGWTGINYVEVQGLKFDGRNNAQFAFKCHNSHHLRFVGNTINNMGTGGIGSMTCDYLTADSNRIHHNGYNIGWASGVTFNSNQWYDTYPGFHNIVVNNIIAGSFDGSTNHTDGNGIIMDLSNRSYDPSTANTPPALIANNVVYMNGGRCIINFIVTNIWTVNNTCYKNGLDLSSSDFGEIANNTANNSFYVNNLVHSWNGRQTYQQYSPSSNVRYYRNIYFGGSNNFSYSDPSQFINADPRFLNPPFLDPIGVGQYALALAPELLGNRLQIQASSAAIDRGVDPTTITGASPEILAGLRQYLFRDANGNPRPQGSSFDVGAYEFGAGLSAPLPPSNLRISD